VWSHKEKKASHVISERSVNCPNFDNVLFKFNLPNYRGYFVSKFTNPRKSSVQELEGSEIHTVTCV